MEAQANKLMEYQVCELFAIRDSAVTQDKSEMPQKRNQEKYQVATE